MHHCRLDKIIENNAEVLKYDYCPVYNLYI